MNSNSTPIRYLRAVGKQPTPQLGWSFLDWFSDYQKPAPLARTPYADNYWNAGVNMAYGRETAYPVRSGGDTGLKPRGSRQAARSWWGLWGPPAVGVEEYNRAKALMDYGNMGEAKAELGDLFNDIMGAVVPGWDARPQALKNIVVKPDPARIMEQVQRIAPNAGEQVVRAANANGLGVFVNTPGGQVEVTPYNAQSFYGLYPFITRAQSAVGSVPMWVWLAGGAGILALVMLKR